MEQSTNNYIFEYLIAKYPDVLILRNANNGFGAGNNYGYLHSKGKYLLFLNPDTKLIEPIGKFAVRKFDKQDTLGMFGVKLIDQCGHSNHSFDSLIPYGLLRKSVTKVFRTLDLFISDLMYTSGADIFIRRECFDLIGKFDENIFLYFEETDLCIRLRELMYKCAYFNEVRIVHLRGQCSDSNALSMYNREIASFVYICKKHSLNYKKYLILEIRLIRIKIKLSKLFHQTIDKIHFEKLIILEKYM